MSSKRIKVNLTLSERFDRYPVLREHVGRAVPFYLSLLCSRFKTLSVHIELDALRAKEHCIAQCSVEDNACREFEISVEESLGLKAFLLALAHECVHIKQYASRHLVSESLNIDHWMGKRFDSRRVEYWDRPWEIEAYGRETGLFWRYCEKYGFEREKWAEL